MDLDNWRHDIFPLTSELDTTGSGGYLNIILHRYMGVHTRKIVMTYEMLD